jgi:hypothetical protein
MNHDKRTGRYQAVTKRSKPYLYAPLSDQKADNKQSNIPFAWSDNRTSAIIIDFNIRQPNLKNLSYLM